MRPRLFERLKIGLRPLRPYRWMRFGYHFLTDPRFRADFKLRWRRPPGLFQHRAITAPNRYPRVFAFIRQQLKDQTEGKLLSFGCATGEEVFSLRDYFPGFRIKGIDISPANVARCLTRHRMEGSDPLLSFEVNHSASAEEARSYDAVFALSVFTLWDLREDPNLASCYPHLNFADFERTAQELARAVRPGGYLAFRHSVFSFADTAAAVDFDSVLRLPIPAGFPRFGPDNRRLPDEPEETAVFRRRWA